MVGKAQELRDREASNHFHPVPGCIGRVVLRPRGAWLALLST